MDLQIIDTSYGDDTLSARLTQTAHTLVPRPGKPARHTVLQVSILNAALDKNSCAKVSVLTDSMEWTEILVLPAGEWRSQVPNPTASNAEPRSAMEELAASLFKRAERILGY
jgi:hypothetical protein